MMKNKPDIRFDGFNDAWEQCDFKDLAKVRRGLTYKPKDIQKKGVRVLRSSNINEDTFELRSDDIFVNQSALNIKSVDENDILITSANGSSRLVGKHALIKNITDLAVHGGFMLLATSEEPYFTNAFMSSSWYSRFIHIYVSGGNGAIGNLSKSDLDSQKIYIPKQFEQQQIGTFFQSLDNLITLHQRELENYKLLKKGFLQKLFPSNGDTNPSIRFDEFTDAWEQRKLSDVMSDFIVPMRDKPKEFSGNTPWTRIEDIEGKYLNGSLSEQYVSSETIKKMNLKIIPRGSLIVSASATFGVVAIVTQDLITNQTFIGLVPERDFDLDFLYVFFQSPAVQRKMKLESAGSTIFYISRQTFENMEFLYPNYSEQKKIGSFFANLDKLITLHQRELDNYKELKKGFLQKMFV